jgi:hypothetical protein
MATRRLKSWLKHCKEIWVEIKKSRGVRSVIALYAIMLAFYKVVGYIEPHLPGFVSRTPKLNALLSWRSWIILALVISIIFIIEGANRVKRRKLRKQAKAHRAEVETWKLNLSETLRQLEQEKAKSSLPELEGKFNYCSVGQWSKDGQFQGTTITVFLVMKNLGFASAVGDWTFYVDFPDGKSLQGAPLIFGDDLPFGMADGTIKILRTIDRLDTKLAETSLVKGVPVNGFLMWVFTGIKRDVIDKAGNKIRLGYSDFTGKSYEIEHDIGTGSRLTKGQSPYIPSMIIKDQESPNDTSKSKHSRTSKTRKTKK